MSFYQVIIMEDMKTARIIWISLKSKPKMQGFLNVLSDVKEPLYLYTYDGLCDGKEILNIINCDLSKPLQFIVDSSDEKVLRPFSLQ